MTNVLSIGSALVDIFIHSSHFQLSQDEGVAMLCQRYGEKLEVDSFEVFTGGGGSNTAVGFSRLGLTASLLAEMGKDAFAQLVENDLVAEQVSDQWLVREKKEQTGGSVIMVGPDGGRTVMVHRGAASQLEVRDIPAAAIENMEWVHLSSIAGHADVLKHIFNLVKQHQIGLSWNPGKAELALIGQEVALSDISAKILILNAEEWAMVAQYQTELQAQIAEIVVTDGSQGGQLFTQGEVQAYPAETVTSVDDTGAGDAFAVGYVSGRLADKNPTEALKWGVANATSVVLQVGAKAGLLTRNRLEAEPS